MDMDKQVLDQEPQDTDPQLFSNAQTAVILLATTALATVGLWQVTGWDITVWWRGLALFVGGYLVAAVVLLGLDQFVQRVSEEYSRLGP